MNSTALLGIRVHDIELMRRLDEAKRTVGQLEIQGEKSIVKMKVLSVELKGIMR